MKAPLPTEHVAFIGNYPPRLCGIATYTRDICEAVATAFPSVSCIAGAMNDRPQGDDYPAQVKFEIDQDDPASYRRAAAFLEINNVEVVSVQHEFGIYGGPAGNLLIEFLSGIDKPVVVTLHTVLESPDAIQRAVMKKIDELCERFIVMAKHGRDLLVRVYGVEEAKIDLIPHGVIDMPFVDANFYKDQFDAEGKTVMLTFGLLSANKGIETVIKAIISTPYRHAEELLADNRGVLVPFSDPAAIARAVHQLRANPTQMTAMRKRAWKEGRAMIWPEVARRSMECFNHARALWAVGTALGHSGNDGFRHLSALLFLRGLAPVKQFSSPRAWAFTLIAVSEYLLSFSGDRTVEKAQRTLLYP